MEVFSFYICRMNNILTDVGTGNQYMIQPSVQELEDGIIQYVPELHAHIIYCVMVNFIPTTQIWLIGIKGWRNGRRVSWVSGHLVHNSQ